MTPDIKELEACAFIQDIIEKRMRHQLDQVSKNSNNYVDVTCLYTFLKFKFAKKGNYIIIRKDATNGIDLPIEPCTVSEGGTTNVRVYFRSPFDLTPLSNYIFSAYSDCYNSMNEYMSVSNYTKKKQSKALVC